MTKREEYLAAKALAEKLKTEEINLRNEVYRHEQAAERLSQPLFDAAIAKREQDVRECRIRMRAKLEELKQLQYQRDDAQRRFNAMHYDCNHRDENDVSTIVSNYTYGSEPGDKTPLRCSTCGETWS